MALAIYKTFTREKLVYQDMNAMQQHYADYINDYCQLKADCVSANTANKAVKRDANGDFAAETITATSFVGDLTGDVTGNCTGDSSNVTTNINGHAIADIFEADGETVKEATHAASADSAKGDTRFQITGQPVSPGNIGAGVAQANQLIVVIVPSGKSLILKRARFALGSDLTLRAFVGAAAGWSSASNYDEEVPNETLYTAVIDTKISIDIRIVNNSVETKTIYAHHSWWLDLAIE